MNIYLFEIENTILNFNLVDQKSHEGKKEAYKEGAQEKGVIGQIGDTLSHAYNYVAEKVSGLYYFLHKRSQSFHFVL